MKETLEQLLSYISAIYRYKYLFVMVSLCVMTAIGAYSFTLPKQYRADTTVFIEKNVIDELVQGIAITPNIEERVRVLQYAILSRDMVVKTLEELDSEIFKEPTAKQQIYISDLIDRTQLNVTRRMDRFTVSLVDKSPEFAQRFINTLVGKYVEENITAKRDETYGANRFLEEQLEIFKDKLEVSEDKIIDFRKQKGIYFSVDEDSTLENIRELMTELDNISLNLDSLLARRKQLQEQLSSTEATVDFVSRSAEADRLTTMENQLNTLLLRYTDNYPEVIRLRAEIESLKQNLLNPNTATKEAGITKMTSLNPLHQELQGQLFELDSELSSLNARKRNLEQNVAKREKELHEVPAAKKELGILMQERDSYRSIYNDLLARMGQSEVSKQMEIGNKASTFRIVDPAVLPETPVSPNMLRMLLLSIAAGVGCGFGLVFLLENMNEQVRSIKGFDSLGVDILAVVPNISDPKLLKRRFRLDVLLVGVSGFYFVGYVGFFAYELFLR